MCFGFLFLLFLFRWFSNLVTCLLFFSNCVGCRLAIFRINLFELYCYPPCWPAATTIRPIGPSFRRRWAIKYVACIFSHSFPIGYFASRIGSKFLRTLKGIIYLLGLFVNSCFSSIVWRRRWWRITSTATTADRYTSSAPSSTLSRTPGRTSSSDDSLSAASSRSRVYKLGIISLFSFLRLILFVLGFPSLFPNQDIFPWNSFFFLFSKLNRFDQLTADTSIIRSFIIFSLHISRLSPTLFLLILFSFFPFFFCDIDIKMFAPPHSEERHVAGGCHEYWLLFSGYIFSFFSFFAHTHKRERDGSFLTHFHSLCFLPPGRECVCAVCRVLLCTRPPRSS